MEIKVLQKDGRFSPSVAKRELLVLKSLNMDKMLI